MAPMAGFESIAAVGLSIERLLDQSFQARPPVPTKVSRARLIQTDDLDPKRNKDLSRPFVSILLYRVDFNKTLRAAMPANDPRNRQLLPLDLHFLLTAWGANASAEHLLIGRTMQVLESRAVLRGPHLDPSGGWDPFDTVELVLEDLTTEDLMQTFYSLTCDFRLSVPYLARVVVLDGDEPDPDELVRTAAAGLRPSMAGAPA